jgi:Flp pilus assembly protein TadD
MSQARTLYKAGIDHFAHGRNGEAIEAYRKALAIDAQLAMAWNGLAMALARDGDLDAAIAAARRYVELEPEEPLAHTSLSMLYQQAGRIPEAEEEKALSMRLQMQRSRG